MTEYKMIIEELRRLLKNTEAEEKEYKNLDCPITAKRLNNCAHGILQAISVVETVHIIFLEKNKIRQVIKK